MEAQIAPPIDESGRKSKKAKSSTEQGPTQLPSSIISVFLNESGERAGPPIDLPVQSTAKQLQHLINTLLNNEDKVACPSKYDWPFST